jgi:hypothetical protein
VGKGGSARFGGIVILSVVGRSYLSERCVLKARSVTEFKRSILIFLIEYMTTVPKGSVINAEIWGNNVCSENIIHNELDSVFHFKCVGIEK